MLNEQATFDASGSSSPGATITSYEWEFGDGTTATGQSVSHSYDTMGNYEVALTVTDEFGETDSTTTLITLERSEGPTASFTVSPETVMLNEQATFDASDSSSPGASITSYEWEFGDGTTATGQSASHTYDTMGEYEVTLTVTDDIGETASTTTTISLERSEGPTATFTTSSTSVSTGDTVTFDASGSSSPGASITSYDWQFGDGASATGQSASHTYDTAGSYDVTLTVTDDVGATATDTTTVDVEESLPAGAIDPSTTITLSAPSAQQWTGVNPSSIDGKSNPTLTLAEGEEYTMEWVNNTSFGHTLEIDTDTEAGGEVVDQPLSDEGYSFTFTATQDMVEYFCRPHRGIGMKGPIEVVTN
jgi:PKD repeat protein